MVWFGLLDRFELVLSVYGCWRGVEDDDLEFVETFGYGGLVEVEDWKWWFCGG